MWSRIVSYIAGSRILYFDFFDISVHFSLCSSFDTCSIISLWYCDSSKQAEATVPWMTERRKEGRPRLLLTQRVVLMGILWPRRKVVKKLWKCYLFAKYRFTVVCCFTVWLLPFHGGISCDDLERFPLLLLLSIPTSQNVKRRIDALTLLGACAPHLLRVSVIT